MPAWLGPVTALSSRRTLIRGCNVQRARSWIQPRLFTSAIGNPEDIAVIGGGVTGLACAYYITKQFPAAKVTIYEKTPRLGGWLQSERVQVNEDGGTILFEAGPRSLRPAGNGALALSMLIDLGLLKDTIWTSKAAPAALNRFIYYPDHLVRLPDPRSPNFGSEMWQTIRSEPLFDGIFSSVLFEAFRSSRHTDVTDESIASFVNRRLGSNMADRLVSAVLHGVYAGDVHQLSARSLFTKAWSTEAEHGSFTSAAITQAFRRPKLASTRERAFLQALTTLPAPTQEVAEKISASSVYTFRNGLAQLSESLVQYLSDKPKVRFQQGCSVDTFDHKPDGTLDIAVKKSGELVNTNHTHAIWTAAPEALTRAHAATGSIKEDLLGIKFATVMTVNLYFKSQDLHPPGFGYLIPLATQLEQNPENALGVVFDDSYARDPASSHDKYFDGPAQDTVKQRGTKLTVMLGGHYWGGWSGYPTNDEGLAMAKSILRRHLNITEEPLAYRVNLNTDCIPQYTVGHHGRLERIHDTLLKQYRGAFRVAGSWVNGVGVNDCLRSAWNTVGDLKHAQRSGLEDVVTPDE